MLCITIKRRIIKCRGMNHLDDQNADFRERVRLEAQNADY
jgi:hypothetical protein